MPATYAHYRLGQIVSNQLKGKEKTIINQYPDLFFIGVHGPDLLFYHNALVPGPVNRIGYSLHERSGFYFFENLGQIIEKEEDPEPYLAYVYGCLTHFALDVYCHDHVEKLAGKGELTHGEIEVNFDRHLLLVDGEDPVAFDQVKHIKTDLSYAKIISKCYPGTTPKQIRRALIEMRLYSHLLVAKSALYKQLIFAVLKLTGNYDSMKGLVFTAEGNPACEQSNHLLEERFLQAVPEAVSYIQGFDRFLKDHKPVTERFFYNFDAQYVGEERTN